MYSDNIMKAVAVHAQYVRQSCIDTRLAFALKGDMKKGLFFRGSESLPFGNSIRSVAELLEYFLTGALPAS